MRSFNKYYSVLLVPGPTTVSGGSSVTSTLVNASISKLIYKLVKRLKGAISSFGHLIKGPPFASLIVWHLY